MHLRLSKIYIHGSKEHPRDKDIRKLFRLLNLKHKATDLEYLHSLCLGFYSGVGLGTCLQTSW